MRRIVVTEFLPLDAVMEDPGGAEGFAQLTRDTLILTYRPAA